MQNIILDAGLTLSRIQFAVTVICHIIFPAISVGLSFWLVFWYGSYLRTGNSDYLKVFQFWKKIFAVGFGIGVVLGTMMTFEFGLNWGKYANAVGPILGVTISMEVITGFFLEAGFIGIMLYGEDRVSKKMMFFTICMVSLGTLLSTTWIMSANSWMQTPAGYKLVNGQFLPESWYQILFNPSFNIRFLHILVGFCISSTLLVTGVAAFYLYKDRFIYLSRKIFNTGVIVISLLIPFQMFIGDSVTFAVGDVQTSKLLALEGHFDSKSSAWYLLTIPDQKNQRNKLAIGIPLLGGQLINHDPAKPIPGISQIPVTEQPNVWHVFYGFRLMFYIAWLIFSIAAIGMLLRLRGRFYKSKAFFRFVSWMAPAGVIAVIGGWITAETGRQPYVVYGLLRTDHAMSNLSMGQIITSLSVIILIYLVLLVLYIRFIRKQVRIGFDEEASKDESKTLQKI